MKQRVDVAVGLEHTIFIIFRLSDLISGNTVGGAGCRSGRLAVLPATRQ